MAGKQAVEVVYSKKALMTDVGDIYVQFMSKEETPTTAPEYENKVYQTPSLDKFNGTIETSEKKVYLSGKLHSTLRSQKSATITIDAGYFPKEFEDRAVGMVKIGDSWAMPDKPVAVPFRLAVPFYDENTDGLIINYAKCTMAPVAVTGETSREEQNEQLNQFVITASPLIYNPDGKSLVFYKMDMAVEQNKRKYDETKLLTQGWYDSKTLGECEKTSVRGDS